jgi:acyl-CoA thioester hydrolase
MGHVNNVRYVDYLQEARVDLMRAHRWAGDGGSAEITEGIIVVRHEVSYRAPLHFSAEPVLIDCWVTELRAARFTMAYEVYREDDAGERTVYLRAKTVLAPFRFATMAPRRLTPEERTALKGYLEPEEPRLVEPLRVTRKDEGHYPVQVRFSDVDVYRHVNNVVYFEYFQEARIRLFAALSRGLGDMSGVRMVIAQTDVDYLEPITLRAAPYDCWSDVVKVGRRSMTIESEICDGDRVLARARVVAVFFDAASESAVEPPEGYRQRLLEFAGLPGGASAG